MVNVWSFNGQILLNVYFMGFSPIKRTTQVGFSLLQRKENYYGKIEVMEKGQ